MAVRNTTTADLAIAAVAVTAGVFVEIVVIDCRLFVAAALPASITASTTASAVKGIVGALIGCGAIDRLTKEQGEVKFCGCLKPTGRSTQPWREYCARACLWGMRAEEGRHGQENSYYVPDGERRRLRAGFLV